MDIFNMVVGIFSVVESIITIISLGYVISIRSHIKSDGNNNELKNINQTNKGKNNNNSINWSEKK